MAIGSLKKLGRKAASREQTSYVESFKNVSLSSDAQLLTQNFSEWCGTLRIKTPDGLRPFELFDWQRQTAELIVGDRAKVGRTIVLLSSRQTGKSSLFLALGAYAAQARQQHTTLFVHKTGKDSGLLARRLKRFLNGVKLRTDSLGLIELLNDSMIHFRSSNPVRGADGAEGAGRGLDSVDVLIVEEAAHTSNLAAVQGVVGPALTFGNPRISVLIGTASNETSHYYKLLSQAAGGADKLEQILEQIRQGAIAPFQIINEKGPGPIGVISNWRCIEAFKQEPDFLGRVKSELNLSDEQIAAEYELKFSAGGDAAVFDFALVQAAATGELDGDDAIEPGGVYFIGVDPSSVGDDYTVCIVLHKKYDVYRVSRVYRKKKGASEAHLAHISDLIRLYRPVSVVCESNGLGQLYLEHLASACRSAYVEGHHTSLSSKELLISRINLALEKSAIMFPPDIIRDELLSFRRTGANRQKLEAATGSHDDTVIALGLALSAAKYGKNLERG